MRFSVASCALLVLTTLALSGCKSSSSTAQAPSWSFSQLNPFKSSSEAPEYPPKPSSLVRPDGSDNPSAGFAATSDKDAPKFSPGGSDTYGSYAGASRSPLAPRVSYGREPASVASTDPTTTPQQGYYDEGAAYGARNTSVASSGAPSSSSPTANPYASLSGDRYASRSFSPSSTTGLYGSSSASPYEAASDRYGSSPNSAASPNNSSSPYGASASPSSVSGASSPYGDSSASSGYPSGSGFRRDPYAPRTASTASPYGASATPSTSAPNSYGTGVSSSPYGTGATASSISHYDTGSAGRYGSMPSTSTAPAPSTSSADRYASAAGATVAAPPSLPSQSDYNPGHTGYSPGQSDYDPGATSYQPPGSTPYQPPASPYTPPAPYATPSSYTSPSSSCCPPSGASSSAATSDADPHYRPGSTSDYPAAAGTMGTPIPSIAYPSAAGSTNSSTW